MEKNKIYITAVILVFITGCGAFYGGMLFGKSKSSNQFRDVSGQRPFNANGTTGQGNRGRQMNGGFVNGEVIAKDEKSITVKSQDGGSKIIFLADSTQITKSASGTLADLTEKTKVMVNGKPNADGSITASFIQIRPESGDPYNRPGNTEIPVQK